MKNGFKPRFAAIVASLLIVGCGSDSDTTTTTTETAPAVTETTPATTTTITLAEFVTGKNLSVSGAEGSAVATFASGGYYEENYSDGGFCNGEWWLLDATTLETTCANEGTTPTADDKSLWEFIGELKVGMTVIFDGNQITITAIN